MDRDTKIAQLVEELESTVKQLLREVIGDDDPRTYETNEQWQETLQTADGKPLGEFDHIEITVYAGTLRSILDLVRPGWNKQEEE